MLPEDMRAFSKTIPVLALLAFTACSPNDNAHTTATTIVPPPPTQHLSVSTRPATKVAAQPDHESAGFDPKKPFLVFNFPPGKSFREGEEVVIDFSLANATLKSDGGEFRVRYNVDDGDMQWIDAWEDLVLSGWMPGKHTIRIELVGPDGWPYKNGDYNVVTRELTITK